MTEPPPPPDIAEIDAIVEAATAHHAAGRLEEAERLYLTAVNRAPEHWRALNNLGGLYLDRKQPAKAVSMLEQAMAVAPQGARTWISYARALINTGAFVEAESLIEAHAQDPRAGAVEVRLRQAWGMALVQGGAPKRAIPLLQRVLELRPDDPDAHGDLGYALLAAGDFMAAAERLERAAELAPDDPGVRLNLGSALLNLGRTQQAETEYRHALRLNPGDAAAARNLGILLQADGRSEEARGLAETAGPELQILAASRRAEQAWSLGRHDEALAAFDEVVALNPGAPEPRYRRAFARLMMRDYDGGWRDFQARWRIPRFVDESVPASSPPITAYFDPELSIERLAGRSVLLVAEQGVGDQLMYASIVPDLARIAAHVTLVCEPRLARLFAASFPEVTVAGNDTAQARLNGFDKVVAMGDLAFLFRRREADFPGAPYLQAGEAARERWLARLGPRTKALRVGVSWRGGLAKTGGARRSVTLEALAPVLDLPGCEFVSLQYGDVAEELARFNAGRAAPIGVFPREAIDDFEELAALVQGLDVVVSVQTALVHLAGALGAPCLTLVAHRPEWIFTAAGETMPWYRSVRLLRQSSPGDWTAPLAQAAEMLKSRMSG